MRWDRPVAPLLALPYFAGQSFDDLSAWRRSPTESGGWCLNEVASHLVDLASTADEAVGNIRLLVDARTRSMVLPG